MSKLEDTRLMIGSLAKLNESGIKIDNVVILMDIAESLAMIADKLCEAESEEEEQQSNEDYAIININGLDEGIRCAMCTNHMKNDRGCDGGCVVDNDMYERVMEVIEKCIQKGNNNG